MAVLRVKIMCFQVRRLRVDTPITVVEWKWVVLPKHAVLHVKSVDLVRRRVPLQVLLRRSPSVQLLLWRVLCMIVLERLV